MHEFRSRTGNMMNLPDFPELALSDASFTYNASTIAYDSIESINFKLAPLLQNRLPRAFWGVDTSRPPESSAQTARLVVQLDDGVIISLSSGWDMSIPRSRVEAICAAAEYLSERTFDRRLARYRKQLADTGCFVYGRYIFEESGDIRRHGRRICNIRDPGFSVVLGDFHIHFELKTTIASLLWSLLGQSGHTIDISKDRDCFLSMYRMMYGTRWPDERYRDDARAAPNDL